MLILCVDENERAVDYLEMILPTGASLKWARRAGEVFRLLGRGDFDLIMVDIDFEDGLGFELIALFRRELPHCPIVVHSESDVAHDVAQCIELGVSDYFPKMVDRKQFLAFLRQSEAIGRNAKAGFDSKRPEMELILDGCADRKRLNAAVRRGFLFLNGEPGTGKRKIAHHLARREPGGAGRRAAPGAGKLLDYRCEFKDAAVQEAELFGADRSPAHGRMISGLLEMKATATLYIGEVTELHRRVQGSLAQAIARKSFRRSNGSCDLPLRCSVIVGSDHDLGSAYLQGRVVPDLLRLLRDNMTLVRPIRDRSQDLIELAWVFLQQAIEQDPARPARRIHPRLMGHFLAEAWPGNISQLRNCIYRTYAVCQGEELLKKDLVAAGYYETRRNP